MRTEAELAETMSACVALNSFEFLGELSQIEAINTAYWHTAGVLMGLTDGMIQGYTKDALIDASYHPKYVEEIGNTALKTYFNKADPINSAFALHCTSYKASFHACAKRLFESRLSNISEFLKVNKNSVSGKYFLALNQIGGKLVFSDDIAHSTTSHSVNAMLIGPMADSVQGVLESVKTVYQGNPYQRVPGNPTPLYDFAVLASAWPKMMGGCLVGTKRSEFGTVFRNWLLVVGAAEFGYEQLLLAAKKQVDEHTAYSNSLIRVIEFFESEKDNPDGKANRLKLRVFLQMGYGLAAYFEKGECVKGDGSLVGLTLGDDNRFWMDFTGEPNHESKD